MNHQTALSDIHTIIDLTAGAFEFQYIETATGGICLAIHAGLDSPGPHSVRIHSACLFGESFGSLECDCKVQLNAALDEVRTRGGAIVYLFQEGRGIGLAGKINAMRLQRDRHLSTTSAFAALGFDADPRRYDHAIEALQTLGVSRQLRVITNNPNKLEALEAAGYEVVERVEPVLRVSAETADFVRQKQVALGHIEYTHLELTRDDR